MRFPSIFINHGGGPLPLLGQQQDISTFLGSYLSTLPQKPTKILLITAHWESDSSGEVLVNSNPTPQLIYDYGGFPPESYEYKYDVPGDSDLASRVCTLCNDGDFGDRKTICKFDSTRAWDHGVFVPLMLLAPSSHKIPVVSMSIIKGYDSLQHIELGEKLASLREEGVLIISSGSSFHSMGHFFAQGQKRQEGIVGARIFDEFLRDILSADSTNSSNPKAALADWRKNESNANEIAHPIGEGEHLIPLMVAFGAGGSKRGKVLKCKRESKTMISEFEMSCFEFN